MVPLEHCPPYIFFVGASMADHVVVVRGLVSSDGVIARVFQVDVEEAGEWDLRSARCSIQQGNSFAGPKLGDAVAYMLGLQHPLIIMRSGSRITICETDMSMDALTDRADQVDVLTSRPQALHEAISGGLDGTLSASLTH